MVPRNSSTTTIKTVLPSFYRLLTVLLLTTKPERGNYAGHDQSLVVGRTSSGVQRGEGVGDSRRRRLVAACIIIRPKKKSESIVNSVERCFFCNTENTVYQVAHKHNVHTPQVRI